ncbi:MAG: ABC transporter ATP-binding protein [Candidatus Competibacteraceae bacterium]
MRSLFVMVRRYLRRIGVERRRANEQRFTAAQEAFGGIKELKVAGLEEAFIERFRAPSLQMARRLTATQLVAELPSFAMQAIVFGGIMIVLLYFLERYGGLQEALPIFSLYALAGYRLMPALQAIYNDLAKIRVDAVVLDAMYQELYLMPLDSAGAISDEGNSRQLEPLRLREALQLVDVSYRYPLAECLTLKGINLRIPALSTVGLVGKTGSGKTTLVDLILGLLKPEGGELVVDNRSITPALQRAWQLSIGYVPQQIYLSDDTVSRNIAFGMPAKRIDQEAVEWAARIANLHDFVVGELPDGYNTLVGERGVRLSGGQRQRIGIARALYRNPDLLILDEATSALDNLTEQAVMEAVHNLGNQKTIILIAHRLSTVRQCDQIFYLEQGQIIAVGTYDELLANNPQFRCLAVGTA